MSTPPRLFLLRHGEVETRYHRVFGGRIDMELSERHQETPGRGQADGKSITSSVAGISVGVAGGQPLLDLRLGKGGIRELLSLQQLAISQA